MRRGVKTDIELQSAFLTPANAMLSVELAHLANMLDATEQLRNVSEQAKQWSSRIHDAIWKTTVLQLLVVLDTCLNAFRLWIISLHTRQMVRKVSSSKESYSHDRLGFGGRYVMDDANVPVSCFYRLLTMDN